MARVTSVTSAKRYAMLRHDPAQVTDRVSNEPVTSGNDNKNSTVTSCNIACNIDVTSDPGKGRERNVEGISPFRGIPDVTPMPRDRAGLHVTNHAILRYQERVSPVTAEQARRALSTRAIQIAAEFGARYVRLATGHRVVIANHAVVTVQPVEHFKRQIHRHGLGRYGKSPYQQEHDHDRHPYD